MNGPMKKRKKRNLNIAQRDLSYEMARWLKKGEKEGNAMCERGGGIIGGNVLW